jgi:hypothetical protein
MKTINSKFKKYFYVVPVFILLLITVNSVGFNKDTIKQEKTSITDEKIKITIDKKTSDNDISKIMSSLRDKGIIAEFKNITRNENNEITAIKINITKNGSTSSYSANSNMGINSIIIDIDGDFVSIHNEGIQVFGFGNNNDDAIISQLMQRQQSFFNNQSEEMELLKKMMQNQNSIFENLNFNFDEDSDPFIERKDINKNDYRYNKTVKETYIVNGKEMTKADYEQMNKSQIKSLEIKKEIVKSYTK